MATPARHRNRPNLKLVPRPVVRLERLDVDPRDLEPLSEAAAFQYGLVLGRQLLANERERKDTRP